jgi:hypothetical protein
MDDVLGAGIAYACAIASGICELAGGIEGALNTGTVNLDNMKGHEELYDRRTNRCDAPAQNSRGASIFLIV